MKAVLISINPPYTSEILSGEKKMEFRKVVIKELQGKETPILIYETKNKGGKGKIVAIAKHHYVLAPNYLKREDTRQSKADQYLLFRQCAYDYGFWKEGQINERIMRSEEFEKHLIRIGQYNGDYNYAIHLENIEPLDIELKDLGVERPPQNMMSIEYKGYELETGWNEKIDLSIKAGLYRVKYIPFFLMDTITAELHYHPQYQTFDDEDGKPVVSIFNISAWKLLKEE